MARFHGKTNLHLGEPVWAGSEYDHEARGYIIDVSGEAAERFRSVASDYGFIEAGHDDADGVVEPVVEPKPEAVAPVEVEQPKGRGFRRN
jgi:hypothetical protein